MRVDPLFSRVSVQLLVLYPILWLLVPTYIDRTCIFYLLALRIRILLYYTIFLKELSDSNVARFAPTLSL